MTRPDFESLAELPMIDSSHCPLTRVELRADHDNLARALAKCTGRRHPAADPRLSYDELYRKRNRLASALADCATQQQEKESR